MSSQMNVAVAQVEDQVEIIKENYMIEYIKYCYENYDNLIYDTYESDDESFAYEFEEKIEVDFDGNKEAMIQDHFIQEIVLSKQSYKEFFESYDWEEKDDEVYEIILGANFGQSRWAFSMIAEFIEEKGIPFIADLIGIELAMLK
jgi:hypothetical protein